MLAQGLTSLTIDGAGSSGLTFSSTSVISSNTSAGAPLIIATDAGNAGTGVVTLSAANTFAGGVVLNTGTLSLTNARALGDRTNMLTINGGRLSGTVTFANAVLLNSTLDFIGTSTLTFNGVLSGSGGVTSSASDTGTRVSLGGINSYTGVTTVRGLHYRGGSS